ncbi:hypothetical protein EXIGLDRAFT_832673 [Exidia glandulosa HHB12029]|uniref:DUF6533 domain-containing protein n=1 Tax=Exidia glandulosa HHB12029 TaxID=1314781 RepID=A0A165LG30_EXIGL|nr:hypothetical protein EXIGLDRAFT_832673 [Exidia glandulosa HHB12029]
MSVALVGTPTGYLQLACLSWFAYDWAIAMDEEVEFIWARNWTFTKVLFILMRWTTAALLVSETIIYVFFENLSQAYACQTFELQPLGTDIAIGTVVVIFEVQIILQLRIYVMYERSRRLLLVNIVLCLLELGCAVVIMAKYFAQARFVEVPEWIMGACYDVRPRVLSTVWVAPLCYELYIAILAVLKVVENKRLGLYGYTDNSNLLSTLVRDSVGYFFLLAACAGVNIVLWSETVVTPGDSAVGLIHAAGGIGGTRLILSMRRAAAQPPPLPVIDSNLVDTAITANFELNTLKSSRKG